MQNILSLAKNVDLISVHLPEDLIDSFSEDALEINSPIAGITLASRNKLGIHNVEDQPNIKTKYRHYGMADWEQKMDRLITRTTHPVIATVYKMSQLFPDRNLYVQFCPVFTNGNAERKNPEDSYLLVRNGPRKDYDGYIVHIQNFDEDKLVHLEYVFSIIEWFEKFHRTECRMHYRDFSID